MRSGGGSRSGGSRSSRSSFRSSSSRYRVFHRGAHGECHHRYACTLLGLVFSISVAFFANAKEIELAPLESRLFDLRDGVWYSLRPGKSVRVLLYHTQPRAVPSGRSLTVHDTFTVKGDEYRYWSRYLNEGSRVTWEMRSKAKMHALVVSGDGQFQRWKDKKSVKSVYRADSVSWIHEDIVAEVNAATDYYWIVESQNATSGSVTFTIEPTIYPEDRASSIAHSRTEITRPSNNAPSWAVFYNPTTDKHLTASMRYELWSRRPKVVLGALILAIALFAGFFRVSPPSPSPPLVRPLAVPAPPMPRPARPAPAPPSPLEPRSPPKEVTDVTEESYVPVSRSPLPPNSPAFIRSSAPPSHPSEEQD